MPQKVFPDFWWKKYKKIEKWKIRIIKVKSSGSKLFKSLGLSGFNNPLFALLVHFE